jgi:hypothetical protein
MKKILILHSNDKVKTLRRILLNFSFCLLKYFPEYEYYLHCSEHDPVTEDLKKENFDIIIFDVSFLSQRYAGIGTGASFLKKYSFLKNSSAIKIALPQDEYNYTMVLDKWLYEWNTNVIFSIFPNLASVLYPLSSQKSEILQAYTGYVDEEDICIGESFALPFEKRAIDVGFRARNLAPNYGRLGYIKAKLGENFIQVCKKNDIKFNFDISTKEEDTLHGTDWLNFLGNSRFTLGSESGCSVMDNLGIIDTKTKSYLKTNPNASFEEVEAACFPGEDEKYAFNAISPRIFEAAIAHSCQVLVEGHYQGIINPYEHYIPIKKDFSNINEVVQIMNDTEQVKKIIDNCYNELITSEKYTYRNFAQRLIKKAYEIKGEPLLEIQDYKPLRKNMEKIILLANNISKKNGFAYIPPNSNCDPTQDIKAIKKAHSLFGKYRKFNWF